MDFENWESDNFVDKLFGEYDDTPMPLPDMELEPHLLISKVRKHYMEYMIRLLSVNYETNQKLLNKNIYLPSAIWRCAKHIETKATQACMVAHLYRKNITSVIKQLKNDTKNGKLYKKLYDCLHKAPENEKKVQTTIRSSGECNCQCTPTVKRKKRPSTSVSPKQFDNTNSFSDIINSDMLKVSNEQYKIPVAIKLHTEPAQVLAPNEVSFSNNSFLQSQHNAIMKIKSQTSNSPKKSTAVPEPQDSDELMMQLEKLFQDSNDDDIFNGALCDPLDIDLASDNIKKPIKNTAEVSVIEDHTAQIKFLDERLATLAGMLVSNTSESSTVHQKTESQRNKKHNSSKWLCEEYFLKQRLYELLDQIGDTNRKELAKIKEKFAHLFGNDSDDEGVVSPLNETPEFIISCKERIAPWVVKLLTPYYIKGRIRGKALFKALAKHLIRLIYQCSRYPEEYEVTSFVSDFLENHQMIRCEADFKQFKIDNI